jgi:hypothetical protein
LSSRVKNIKKAFLSIDGHLLSAPKRKQNEQTHSVTTTKKGRRRMVDKAKEKKKKDKKEKFGFTCSYLPT